MLSNKTQALSKSVNWDILVIGTIFILKLHVFKNKVVRDQNLVLCDKSILHSLFYLSLQWLTSFWKINHWLQPMQLIPDLFLFFEKALNKLLPQKQVVCSLVSISVDSP